MEGDNNPDTLQGRIIPQKMDKTADLLLPPGFHKAPGLIMNSWYFWQKEKFYGMKYWILFLLLIVFVGTKAQPGSPVLPGASSMDKYLPLLKGKSVAVFANVTSVVGNTNLVDTLQKKGIDIKKIFSPEHGFRGKADAGEEVSSAVDQQTGIPIISLYGDHLAPSAEDLKDVDILIFDIQDVGARFYTYISSLEYFLAAAIKNEKPLLLLDRPNPNGYYVDGPVLDPKFRSFVGMQSVPVVYGMTIGEYAKMLLGESWVGGKPGSQASSGAKSQGFKLTVIPCRNYTHHSRYALPVKPSPNLPNMASVYLYPSTCFFEGTVLSEGRGTDKPFQEFGHPLLPKELKTFTPASREGAKHPKLEGQTCYGWDLSGPEEEVLKKVDGKVQIKWLMEAYRLFPDKDKFFLANGWINKLAGTDQLAIQIKNGKSEQEIRKSWEPGLQAFRKIRKKYLIYPE